MTTELTTANVAYFQRKIQLSGLLHNQMTRRPQFLQISGVLLYCITVRCLNGRSTTTFTDSVQVISYYHWPSPRCLSCDVIFLDNPHSSGVPREVGLGRSNSPPPNSEGPPKSCQTQPDSENLKIYVLRTPTPQDVLKKGSKILKLPRFVTVLH